MGNPRGKNRSPWTSKIERRAHQVATKKKAAKKGGKKR